MEAAQTHVIALIKSKNFEGAIEFIKKSPLSSELTFEFAYAMHRGGNNEKAVELID